jgi:hypothetical protein
LLHFIKSEIEPIFTPNCTNETLKDNQTIMKKMFSNILSITGGMDDVSIEI